MIRARAEARMGYIKAMENLSYAVGRLIDTVKASNEYQDYYRVKENVKQYPDLKEEIDIFRQRNFEIQNSADAAFDKIEQLEMEYAAFREHPLVDEFLKVELAFCRLMQGINLRIVDAMDFE